MRSLFSILACFVLSGLLHAQVQLPVQWVKQYGYTDEEYAFGIAADDSSNVFVTGLIGPGDSSFHNKAQCANHDIFVARYDAQGNAQWLYKIGAFGTDIGWGIAVDKDHNVCTASSFQDQLALATDTVTCAGFIDMLVTKFDAQGHLLWARSGGGVFDDEAYAIATDSHNNIYVTGIFEDTAHFDTVSLICKGQRDALLAKYSSNGTLLWAKDIGSGSGDEGGYAIAIDKWDNLYVTGKFSDTAIFSIDTLISRGSSDIFIAKYDTLGVLQWIRQTGGPGADIGQGIHTGTDGSVFVSGYFRQTSVFGSDTLAAIGGSDIFISKYGAQGALAWTKSGGGKSNDEGAAVTVDIHGKIYVSGYVSDTVSFGSQVSYPMGSYDACLACYDTAGNIEWVKRGGGPGMEAAGAVCADTLGSIYAAGICDYTCAFDTLFALSSYDQNFFIAKFGLNTPVAVTEAINNNNDLILFPNPSSGRITLRLSKSNAGGSVRILNPIGELVLEKKILAATDLNLDLSHLSKGMYVVRADVTEGTILKKVILE